MGALLDCSLEHFARISIFGQSEPAFWAVVAASIAFTAIHVWQEAKARPPLYRVFGAISGFWFPEWAGVLAFSVGLPIFLWAIALVAYAGCLPGLRCAKLMPFALGLLLGARIGDSIVSHWTLFLVGFRPNPGLSSTVLYVLEAVLILAAFRPGLAADRHSSLYGVVLGFAFFLAIIPFMAFVLRNIVKNSKRKSWSPSAPFPDWAKEWK